MDQELGFFGVRAVEPRELARQAAFAKQMLFAAAAASLAILAASAFFVSVML